MTESAFVKSVLQQASKKDAIEQLDKVNLTKRERMVAEYIYFDGLTTEDGKEVTVILYYNRKDQSEFKSAANTAAGKYSNQNNTYVLGVYTADDFKKQWNSLALAHS